MQNILIPILQSHNFKYYDVINAINQFNNTFRTLYYCSECKYISSRYENLIKHFNGNKSHKLEPHIKSISDRDSLTSIMQTLDSNDIDLIEVI